MLTLVQVARSPQSASETTALVADYLRYERHRRESRPYLHVCAAFAALVLIGGAAGSVPRSESIIAAAVLLVPVVALGAANAWRWWQLRRRLSEIQAEIHQRTHKKVVKTA